MDVMVLKCGLMWERSEIWEQLELVTISADFFITESEVLVYEGF